MCRPFSKATLVFLAITGGQAVINPAEVSASPHIHVVVITDDLDPRVGDAVSNSGEDVQRSFASHVPIDRYSLKPIGGASVSPAAILDAIAALPVRRGEDTVVVYSASHGGYDPNLGSYLYFPRTQQSLTRTDLRAAIEAKGARLGILITESCNDLKEIRRPRKKFHFAPSAQAPEPLTDVHPLFRALFLSHAGFVDLASSKRGERSLCYPRIKEGDTTANRPEGIFTASLLSVIQSRYMEILTWAQVAAEVAPKVLAAFATHAPDGLEDENDPDPDKAQRTQTVDLRSAGTWSPAAEVASHRPSAPNHSRLGALGNGVAGRGVLISWVKPGSAAERLGIEPGDEIVSINGVGLDSNEEYMRLVKSSPRRIALGVRDVRTGQINRGEVDLDDVDEAPRPTPAPTRSRFGAVAVPYAGPGLFVTHLVPDSPAARLGLEYGDVIAEINGRKIIDLESYYGAVRDSGRAMELTIINVRNGQRQSSTVMLDD